MIPNNANLDDDPEFVLIQEQGGQHLLRKVDDHPSGKRIYYEVVEQLSLAFDSEASETDDPEFGAVGAVQSQAQHSAQPAQTAAKEPILRHGVEAFLAKVPAPMPTASPLGSDSTNIPHPLLPRVIPFIAVFLGPSLRHEVLDDLERNYQRDIVERKWSRGMAIACAVTCALEALAGFWFNLDRLQKIATIIGTLRKATAK